MTVCELCLGSRHGCSDKQYQQSAKFELAGSGSCRFSWIRAPEALGTRNNRRKVGNDSVDVDRVSSEAFLWFVGVVGTGAD